MSDIRQLANEVGFKGTPNHRIAEPSSVRTLPVIDNSVPTQSNVRTSVDCYVSGQYVQKNGKVTEVTQRYTIFVAYSNQTQMQTMQQVRDRIISDFEAKYGKTFNVTNTFVPGLPVPQKDLPGTGAGGVAPLEMYRGSDMFREMTRHERARYDIGTQKKQATVNIGNIKTRYGVKR
jgi:hypothetical protein